MLKLELKKTEKIIFISSVILFLVMLFSFLFLESESIKKTILNTFQGILFLFAAVFCYNTSHRNNNYYFTKLFWLLICSSAIFYFVGQIQFAYYEFLGLNPFPTIADLFFTLFYLLFFVAFLFIPLRKIPKTKNRQFIVEYIVLSIGIIVISYNFLSLSITNYLSKNNFDLALAITITYTSLDVLIILISLFHLLRLDAEDPNYLIVFILLFGAICYAIGDFYLQLGIPFSIVFVGGQISDIFWSLLPLIWMLAATLSNNITSLKKYLCYNPKIISFNKSIAFSLSSIIILVLLFQLIWSFYYPLAFNLITMVITITIFSVYASYRQIKLYMELDQLNSNLINAYHQLSAANDELKVLNEDLRIETQALEESQSELQNQIETKNKIFSIISHDIRSPLGGIMMGFDTIERYFDNLTKEEILQFIQVNNIAARNLFQFVEGLLEWARIQMGNFKLFHDFYYFQELAFETISLVQAKAKEKNIDIELVSKLDEQIYVDGEGFKTILRNILTNAVKFSPNNSKITILGENFDDSFVKVSITDKGIGMSQEDVDKLFDKKANPKLIGNSSEKGTGLGLLICKEIVELHKGKIWVESQLNVGTTFSFILPKNNFDCNKEVINE